MILPGNGKKNGTKIKNVGLPVEFKWIHGTSKLVLCRPHCDQLGGICEDLPKSSGKFHEFEHIEVLKNVIQVPIFGVQSQFCTWFQGGTDTLLDYNKEPLTSEAKRR